MVPSLRMFRLQNHWTNSEEIWYERYATGAHTRNSNSHRIDNRVIWRTNELVSANEICEKYKMFVEAIFWKYENERQAM